jgi:hypothetical protein
MGESEKDERGTGEGEKERKFLPVFMRAEDAKYIDHIREKILFIICMNKEKCRAIYSKKLSKAAILGALVRKAFFNDDLILELAKELVVDEFAYNAIMDKIKEREEQKKKQEEEQKAKEEKYKVITVKCQDAQKCLEEAMETAKEFRRMMGLED